MSTGTVPEQTRQQPYPVSGITAAARELGVTRQHLTSCLNGRRESPDLVRRYGLLKAGANDLAATNSDFSQAIDSAEASLHRLDASLDAALESGRSVAGQLAGISADCAALRELIAFAQPKPIPAP